MVDSLILVALGTAATGIVLWFVTNYHIRWTKRALQAYGEDARLRTEAFVARELQTLESSYVQHTKSLTERVSELQAAVPEAGSDRLESLDTRIDTLIADLKGRFDELPMRIRQSFGGVKGQEFKGEDQAVRAVTEEFKAMAMQDMDPQTVMQKQMIEWINRPVSKKATPAEEAITMLAKRAAAELLMRGTASGTPGSVTYTVSQPGDKNFKMEM